ncbi:MAG: iron-containing alcohol dehydrogenase [Pseudomonadota bacterium]
MSSLGVLRSPETVLFAEGALNVLPEQIEKFGSKVLVCTDAVVADFPAVLEILSAMRAKDIEVAVYSETTPELPISCVHDCIEKQSDFTPDVVVGLGGGSSIDLAKLVALALRHGRELSNFYGENLVPGPTVPIIAVPTTAGTGSEATPVAVLDDQGRELKVGISSRYLIPRVALVDPSLTLSCPAVLTAASGADAMTHAIEAFTAIKRDPDPGLETSGVFVGKNDLSDMFALEAVGLISRNLETAVFEGANPDARNAMAKGSLLAGLSFGSAGTAAAHAIQYPIGAQTKTPHGLGVAALMPYVMAFNRSHCTTEYAVLAQVMGAGGGSSETLADQAVEMVAGLFANVGIPKTLPELGVTADQLEWIIDRSLLPARLVNNNPRPLDRDGIKEIVTNAMSGTLTIRRKETA